MREERLQKVLARAGFGGRRTAEAVIAAGRVTVDGVVATLGAKVDPDLARIEVDGQPITLETRELTLVLNKPTGYVVTRNDERGRPTVYDLVQYAPENLRYVGRLDGDTSGLLLLTTDGELAHRLTHPSYRVDKVYEAHVEGRVPDGALQRMADGLILDDGPTQPAEITRLPGEEPPTRVRVVIHEGRNRQVRRMFDAVGHLVFRLHRTQVGPVHLGDLRLGTIRPVTADEERALRALVGLDGANDQERTVPQP